MKFEFELNDIELVAIASDYHISKLVNLGHLDAYYSNENMDMTDILAKLSHLFFKYRRINVFGEERSIRINESANNLLGNIDSEPYLKTESGKAIELVACMTMTYDIYKYYSNNITLRSNEKLRTFIKSYISNSENFEPSSAVSSLTRMQLQLLFDIPLVNMYADCISNSSSFSKSSVFNKIILELTEEILTQDNLNYSESLFMDIFIDYIMQNVIQRDLNTLRGIKRFFNIPGSENRIEFFYKNNEKLFKILKDTATKNYGKDELDKYKNFIKKFDKFYVDLKLQ